ncbi:hypothetical protein [Bradyrhizobium sp. USDA 3315]
MLGFPPSTVRRRLTIRDEEMTRLRLSSPFVLVEGVNFEDGTLRRRIWKAAKRIADEICDPSNSGASADGRVTQGSFVRTIEALVETVTVIARLFKTDKVFIIGSLSIREGQGVRGKLSQGAVI